MRRLYNWIMRQAAGPYATPVLAFLSFLESSFFPIPPDVMLAPMVLARPEKGYVYATICTAASVLGGMFGYFIGYHRGPLGLWLLTLMGHADGQAAFEKWFADWGLWVILIKGLTPIPYKLVTIASGLAHFSFFTFIWASVVTRGARFFLAATLIKYCGPAVREEVEKRLARYTTLGVLVLVGGVVALKFL
jgi:membrane protein YqaA with SNARE-associated domain